MKRILIVLIIVILTLSIVGCSSVPAVSDNEDKGDEVSKSTPEPTVELTPEPTPEPIEIQYKGLKNGKALYADILIAEGTEPTMSQEFDDGGMLYMYSNINFLEQSVYLAQYFYSEDSVTIMLDCQSTDISKRDETYKYFDNYFVSEYGEPYNSGEVDGMPTSTWMADGAAVTISYSGDKDIRIMFVFKT